MVRRVCEQGAYADRVFAGSAEGLAPRERALAMQLAYGTIQRRATLDHVAGALVRKPLQALDPHVLAGLRLGLFQLLYLHGVADHAAVNETVEIVKGTGLGGAGLVNAVLRRAAVEAPAILAGLDDRDPAGAALLHSVPEWLTQKWFKELGPERCRAVLGVINTPAETAIRVNTLVTAADGALAELDVPAVSAPALPEGLVVDGPLDVEASSAYQRGAIMPQSRASMLVSRILDPQPGQRVLDLCAAPGAKTTHLAALMEDVGTVDAIERHPGRAEALRRTCSRMGARCVTVQVSDAVLPRAEAPYDRVLVDPPCSGLGTLQSRPDRRWRASAQAIPELAALQARILARAAAATRPGAVIVYSVCTISHQEGLEVMAAFLRAHSSFGVDDLGASYPEWSDRRDGRYLQLLPDRDGTDGFFIARVRNHQGERSARGRPNAGGAPLD